MTDIKLTVNIRDLTGGICASDIGPKFFLFRPQNSPEILRLDEEGMTFMGERITDAGAAYAAWMKTMAIMQGQYAQPKYLLTNEEIEEVYMRFPTTPHLFAKAIEQKIWEKAE